MQIYGLKPGDRIRIKKTFLDFDGNEQLAGSELQVLSHSVFPYEDGHTFTFTNGARFRLSGNVPDNERILSDVSNEYFDISL